jgi:hypothetical protein
MRLPVSEPRCARKKLRKLQDQSMTAWEGEKEIYFSDCIGSRSCFDQLIPLVSPLLSQAVRCQPATPTETQL